MDYMYMIKKVKDFYVVLVVDNIKDWWLENKVIYDVDFKVFVFVLIDEIVFKLLEMCGEFVMGKLFWFYCDVWFFKDKCFYKEYLYMLW